MARFAAAFPPSPCSRPVGAQFEVLASRVAQRKAVLLVAPVPCLRILAFVAIMSITASAPAQSPDAERRFREWATERVEVLAKNRDPAKRAEAAEYLGSFTYPDVIAALAAALADPDARVRAAAAGSLWDSGKASEAARPALLRALDD